MYTSCPECGTVFRISTHDLRVADGHVRCGHCSATFNALATLSDEPPPATMPVLPPEPDEPARPVDVQEAEAEIEVEVEVGVEAEVGDDDTLEFDIPEDNWSSFFKDHKLSRVRLEPVDAPLPTEPAAGPVVGPAAEAESTEAPAELPASDDDDDNWQELLKEVPDDDAESVYVIEADTPQPERGPEPEPEPIAPEPFMPAGTPWDEPALDATGTPAPLPADFTADLARVDLAGTDLARADMAGHETDADKPDSGAGPEDGRQAPGMPEVWGSDRPFAWTPPPPAAAEPPRRWVYAVGSVLLAVALLMQLLHLRRDELATHPTLTAPLQRLYGALGIPLWPAWDLRAYEVRNYEAVADRSSRGALDILARIAVVGNERVGLPLVRITLSDRFGQTLGSRVFRPDEYLGENPPPREPVSPGTLIPVEITLKDPGPDAQGFDVDICLMSQHDGITCQSEREPFAR